MENKLIDTVKNLLKNLPSDWLKLTTHRLDIYREEQAKTEFLSEFEKLIEQGRLDLAALEQLPTAYDYIRLGHPLSSVLEWTLAKLHNTQVEEVICFSSQTMPLLAVLRKNQESNKKTHVYYLGEAPRGFDFDSFRKVYGYNFEDQSIDNLDEIQKQGETQVFIEQDAQFGKENLQDQIEFTLSLYEGLGSIIFAKNQADYVSEIQHVRRRESIAMTPSNCHIALQKLLHYPIEKEASYSNASKNKEKVFDCIRSITGSEHPSIIGSSGLSIQYAIMMGLIEDAIENHPNKSIQIIVPPNCYGGTNDQARRVAACLGQVSIVDLPVDGENDMVQSTNQVLDRAAQADAVPLIIAEIPTNPRVEVPQLEELAAALTHNRKTPSGEIAVDPVFILDQTFCPNVPFAKDDGILSKVRLISYVSGSKFPSGGKCTAGYCVTNTRAKDLMKKMAKHLSICDNEATALQIEILSEQMPSMIQRIQGAYENTLDFVQFIQKTLPEAKINFVSQKLAEQGFTPSVFSLDLPSKGNSPEEKEEYKRALNHRLIKRMIEQIPNESKYCVSYGQLKGCYWTIPATSTQGTTKEGDKDYIARVSVSPDLNLELHKKVFADFALEI